MKSIREDYAKQYEQKMNRGFEEIMDLKKDMALKQEVHETKQIRDLRRELKKLEDQVIDHQNQKIELKKQNENLQLVIKEKDIHLGTVMNSATSQDGAVTALKNQVNEKNLQIEAMYVKMDLLKKGLDDLNIKYLDSQEQLGQLSSSDFAK